MNAAELRRWLERRGWTYAEAASHLGSDPSSVSRWANGKRKIPGTVARIVELMDEQDRRKSSETPNG